MEANPGHLEWTLPKYWQHAQHWHNDKCSKKHIRTLTTISYLSETIFKWSYWSADKNIHDIGKRHILERENSYLENNQVSKVEWWRRLRAAACKTHELQAQYLEISLTILNKNCWNTDKNMCNIGKMTCFKKETRTFISERSYPNLILQCNHPQRKLLMYGQKHTRHWQSDKFQKEKIVPWKSLRFQSRSAKVLNSCCMHTTGTEISVWKVICTIVKGSCQSIDKNMCKVDITNYFDSVKFCLSKPRKCYEKLFLFCFLK